MSKKVVQAFFGTGKGKTSAAVGQCIRSASLGYSTIVIQFLKGNDAEEFSYLSKLNSDDIKLFRFDKHRRKFCDLNEEEKKEETQNVLNGFHFAKKVLETGECDVLILDEVLGMVDLGIITVEDIIELINCNDMAERIVLTGNELPDELLPHLDVISEIQLIKDNTEIQLIKDNT